MQQPLGLRDAMSVYFSAKAQMFASVPTFRLLDVGPLKCIHNHPGWPEVDGFYAVDGEAAPSDVVAAIRAYHPDPKHMLTVLTASPEAILASYIDLAYQPVPNTERFMSASLASSPSADKDVPVRRAETLVDVELMSSQQVMPEHLNDELYRYYYVPCDGRAVCWGRCVVVSPEAIYVSGMGTAPEHRRRGLAAALMNRIHTDAAEAGAKQSVLCSTSVGYGLYSKVGYTLLAHTPSFVPQAMNTA